MKSSPVQPKVRYWIEIDEHGERLIMPLRRHWSAVLWAFVGICVLAFQHADEFVSDPSALDLTVGVMLIAAVVHILINIMTSMLAREVIQIKEGHLVHGWRVLGLRRERRYRLAEIRSLSAERGTKLPDQNQLISPFKDFGKVGVVNFDYDGQTVGIGAALDEAHGQHVVIWIARRGPRSLLDG